jgi:hypothetical protein
MHMLSPLIAAPPHYPESGQIDLILDFPARSALE